ncbi:macrophage mannose receptor 1-like [Haliotis rufescens]|uniref:macrophage mannose receptor 1-like n=1 Tax=Haliotis rufescens TaxID=6454 RepID=UPI00201EF7E1|nr:macrophage mannose receptor 1-like [Haliotis rufescens]
MQRKQDAIGNRVTSLAVISHTTAIIKPPSSTEGHLTVASSTVTSVPPPTSSPLAVRRMTKGACRKHNGYTFMSRTSMCIRHSTGKPVTWFEARQICRAEGGDLVKLTSSWKGRVCHDFVHYKPVKKPYWIGLQMNAHGGRWVGGDSMVYCNFMFNIVPTASSPVCVRVNKGPFRIWKKADCNSTDVKNLVCEIV